VADGLLTPAELAAWLSVDRSYVYAHAEELGVLRLGTGPRARLRFDREEVARRLSTCSKGRESNSPDPAQDAGKRRRRRKSLGTGGELLPIRGRIEAA
jgi:hypothetical protein